MGNVRWIGLVLAIITLGMTGCCNHPEEYHYAIPATVDAMNPYGVNSIFHLRHSSGAIVRLEALSESRSESQVQNCADCCSKEYEDRYTIVFRSDSASLQLQLEITQTGEKGVYAPANVAFTFNTSGIFYGEFADGSCTSQSSQFGCIDSATVAGQNYTSLIEFYNQGSNHGPAVAQSLLFSPQQGLVKLTTYDGSSWELVR